MKIECGPENCPLTAWAALSPSERKAQRKPLAERLYQQGFTMEQIAEQFGVSQRTISEDLRSLEDTSKLEPRTSKRGRKGEGRPRGSGKRQRPFKSDAAKRDLAASLFLDQGLSREQVMAKTGMGQKEIEGSIAHERGRREAEPQIDPETFAPSIKEKFAAAVRQYQRKLDAQFEQRVLDEVKHRIDEIVLPHWKEQIDQAQDLYRYRRGAMDKETFNTIRRALHPDSRQAISDKKLAEAFDTFMRLEKFLLDEKDSPTEIGPLPSSLTEWDKMRRKPKRGNANISRR